MGAERYVVIVAGGSGNRMNSSIPKQFIPLHGLPILMHTVKRFHSYSPQLQIILCLPPAQVEYWNKLCSEYAFQIPLKIVHGGETRFQSVKNGLSAITDPNALVAVHDGVRPFVNNEIIDQAFNTCEEKGNSVVSVALKDSIREVINDTTKAADRSRYRIIQTPQCFKVSVLIQAYNQTEKPEFTDDASIAESMGETINLIEGTYANIKITSPEDLIIGESLMKAGY